MRREVPRRFGGAPSAVLGAERVLAARSTRIDTLRCWTTSKELLTASPNGRRWRVPTNAAFEILAKDETGCTLWSEYFGALDERNTNRTLRRCFVARATPPPTQGVGPQRTCLRRTRPNRFVVSSRCWQKIGSLDTVACIHTEFDPRLAKE